MKKKGFSKQLLVADYVVAIALIVGFFICLFANGIYSKEMINTLVASGVDVSMITVPQVFNLDGFGILLGTWIAQTGISSTAYYALVKYERKTQMPMMLINDLPDDIKKDVDMTQLITSVLSVSE